MIYFNLQLTSILFYFQLDKKILEKIASSEINETVDVSLLERCYKNGTELSCKLMFHFNILFTN